jgi:pimeloyl-ACP methyl ester carboxylesterase
MSTPFPRFISSALAALITVSAVTVMATAAGGATTTGLPPQVADRAGTTWLCRPGLANNPCTTNISTTSVSANGTTTSTRTAVAKNPKIDCFYVYPTVSPQQRSNASLRIQNEETATATQQVAPYSSVCKVYAPMYRQLTLRAISGNGLSTLAVATAYTSMLRGWRDYLAHYNHGRGFVLIGHSQGAAMLIGLMKRQIDNNPTLRKHLISAIVLGGNVTVPVGKTVGGDFAHIPACTTSTETGCVVAYSSFLTQPPPNTLFGKPGTGVSLLTPGLITTTPAIPLQVLCVNPAALGTTAAAPLNPNFASFRAADPPTQPFATGRVTYPGLYRGQCMYKNGISWLQVNVNHTAGDTRPVVTQSIGPTWGLHLDDANITQGNLVALVKKQAASYRG